MAEPRARGSMARPLQSKVDLSASEFANIGANLYRGISYNGRPAWQAWLAEGLGVNAATIRRWLMEEALSRRSMPRPVSALLIAANGIADRLQMWRQPRGKLIVQRMADLASPTTTSGDRLEITSTFNAPS